VFWVAIRFLDGVRSWNEVISIEITESGSEGGGLRVATGPSTIFLGLLL
jgi:hypothetical protein